MKKHYKIMGVLGFDIFAEEIKLDSHVEATRHLEGNIEELIDRIAEYIDNKLSSVPDLVKKMDDLFLDQMADYFYHYMLFGDEDMKNALKEYSQQSYEIVGKSEFLRILKEYLIENGIEFN